MEIREELRLYARGIRILYVEDDEVIRQGIVELLKRVFTVVDMVASGREALERFSEEHYDILLADIVMPDFDGIKLCQQIRRRCPEFPIVIVSAYSDEDRLLELIRLSITRFVTKPIVVDDLFKALSDVCKKLKFDEQQERYERRLIEKNAELKKTNFRLNSAEQIAHLAYWEVNPANNYLWVSEQMRSIVGLENSDTELTLEWYKEHMIPEERHLIEKYIDEGLAGNAFVFKHYFIGDLGQKKVLEVSGQPYSQKSEALLMGTTQDVTESWKLKREMELASQIIEKSIESIIVTDETMRITQVNQSFTKITGFEKEEVLGREPSILKSGWHDQDFYRQFWSSIEANGYWCGEMWDRKKSGELYAGWLSVFVIRDGFGAVQNYVGMFTDITQIKKDQEKIVNLAYYDPLTKLPNRILFHDRLRKSMEFSARHHNRTILLFIDMDNFKIINDTLGHRIGDMFLVEIGERIKTCLRESDSVARLGGDEFTVIIPNTSDTQDGGLVAERILEAFKIPCSLNGHEVHCSASIGIAVYDSKENSDIEELLKQADTAMYHAKQEGKNRFRYYEDSMQESFGDFMKIEHGLWKALEQEGLELYYQPIMDASEGYFTTFEALLRWHSDDGLKTPESFMHVIEKTELIFPVGRWVLEQAIQQLRQWQKHRPDIRVSVNVSPLQFRESAFVGHIEELLQRYEADGHGLVIEVTETVMLHEPDEVVAKIHALKKLGVTFSLDDFGSGYSSLNHLRALPVDSVKIDKSFVIDSLEDEACQDIIRGIVHIAHSLKLKVIAEGSETDSHTRMLKAQKCDAIQGYHYGKPMPVCDIEALFDKMET